jgi:hypothetical protein
MSTPLLNLVLSDTHCGGDCALFPPEVELEDGTVIGHGRNKRLKWLWNCFLEMQTRFKAIRDGDPYILTLNGDLIEGIHHRTEEVVSAKIMEHLTVAYVALGDLIRGAERVIVTRGTECHVRDLENVLCKEFGIAKAKDVQQYTVHGTLVDARHHMPVTGRKHLESSALGIVMANCISNMTRAGHPVPKVFLRGHRHTGGAYDDGENMIVVNGAWQFLTRHGNKVVTDSIPRASAHVLDWRHCPKNSLPALHRMYYTPPAELTHS